MSNDSKIQPTGWVVVDFDDGLATFRDSRTWQPWHGPVIPFASRSDADGYKEGLPLRKLCEVHPWPLPASMLDRLKAKHPRQDWSQVPVADAPVEKPGRWVLQELPDEPDLPFRDQDGWQQSADVCLMPWSTKADVEAFMRSKGWISDSFVPVNLDDLPAPAVAEPSEVEKLRAEVERLTQERDRAVRALTRAGYEDRGGAEWVPPVGPNPSPLLSHIDDLRAEVERLTRERDEHQSDADVLRKDLAAYADQLCAIWALLPDDIATQGGPAASAVRGFIDRLTRECDDLREELSRCKQAHSAAEDDVESLREQVSKATLSRRDEFAKAALTGVLAQDTDGRLNTKETAEEAVKVADATIRALDGAGGAS